MVVEKKKNTIFRRLTNRFINSHRNLKRDQSVQTGHHHQSVAMTILVDSQRTTSSESQHVHSQTPSTRRRRSSLKTFLTFQSPKPISMINRVRRRSINLKTPKRLSSECLVS